MLTLSRICFGTWRIVAALIEWRRNHRTRTVTRLLPLVAIASLPLSVRAAEIIGQSSDAQMTWTLSPGSEPATISANTVALDAAFTWMRAQKGGDQERRVRIVFPAGVYCVGNSLSPSGHAAGQGLVGAKNCTLEFAAAPAATEMVFTGPASTYDEITIEQGGTWKALNNFSMLGSDRSYWRGSDLHELNGAVKRHYVAFNVRNSGEIQVRGNLELTRQRPVGVELKDDPLFAVGSSGGDRDMYEFSGMQRSSIESLAITGFNTGLFGEEYDSGTAKCADTFTGVAMSRVVMRGMHRCFVGGANHFDGLNIADFDGEASETSYLFGIRVLNIDRGVFKSTAPAAPVVPDRFPKFLEISQSEVHIGQLNVVYASDGGCYSAISMVVNASLVIDSIAKEPGNNSRSGALITSGRNDAGNFSPLTNLTILATANQSAATTPLVGLAVPAGTNGRRKIRLGSLGSPLANTLAAPVILITDFDSAPSVAASDDKIWFSTTGGGTHYYRVGMAGSQPVLVEQPLNQ